MKKHNRWVAWMSLLFAMLLCLSACSGQTTGNGETDAGGTTGAPNVESSDNTTDGDESDAQIPSAFDDPEPSDHIEADNEITLNMSAFATIETFYDANDVHCRIVQGGCTDGEFLYVAINDGQSKNPDSISAIRKFDISTGKLLATFEGLEIAHCNDMTYNPETSEILMIHNSPERNIVSVYDADSLEFKHEITLDLEIYSMAYDPYEECYWVGISYGFTFAKLDFDFQQIGEIYEGYESGYTKQGMDIDSKYIYFLQYKENCIQVYDKSGAHVRQIDLPKTSHEPENICHIGDTFYISYLESKGGTVYRTTFTEDAGVSIDVEMSKLMTFETYTDDDGMLYETSQGMCTDGEYLYVALNNDKSANYRSIIYKIDPKSKEIVATHEGIKAGLTNDLVYNPDTDEIIAVHNGNTRSIISIYDADTLAFVKDVTLYTDIYAMAYDSVQHCYWIGISGGYDFARLDADFKKIGTVYPGQNVGNKKQGMDCDGENLYFTLSDVNHLAVYRTDGTYLGVVALPVASDYVQDICRVGDTYYIVYNVSSAGGAIYTATVTIE